MSGLLTKAEIAQGSMSNSECSDSLARSFETRSRPRFDSCAPAHSTSGLPIYVADVPRGSILAATLAT
jgi:hypothetical protein